ncbi:hypothetical protein [Curtobacterium sp. PhB25]|uniref:hypothetical protein n=1 Tax=Curtobacterium sp. PhB25 TaxID=2485205 RepID=UPI001FB9CE4A|nr:hypothetical protein [Curtobacterium sp. PhB25]
MVTSRGRDPQARRRIEHQQSGRIGIEQRHRLVNEHLHAGLVIRRGGDVADERDDGTQQSTFTVHGHVAHS